MRVYFAIAEDFARSRTPGDRWTMIGFQQTVRGVHPTAEALSAASHERVLGARDREPVGRNFRKFQNDVVLLSAGVRDHSGWRHTAVLLSFSLFTVTYVTRCEISISLSLDLSDSTRLIRAYRERVCMKIAHENEMCRMHPTCTASGNVVHLPRFSSRCSRTLTRNHWQITMRRWTAPGKTGVYCKSHDEKITRAVITLSRCASERIQSAPTIDGKSRLCNYRREKNINAGWDDWILYVDDTGKRLSYADIYY